jgi:hypothetical protein
VGDAAIEEADKWMKNYATRLKTGRLRDKTMKEEFFKAVANEKSQVSQCYDVDSKWKVNKEIWLKAAE